jgi:hypothetical protein
MSNEEFVVCQECGQKFNTAVVPSHLTNKHKMTTKEYKEKYPNCPTTTPSYDARMKEVRYKFTKKKNEDYDISIEYDNKNTEINMKTLAQKIEKTTQPKVMEIDFSKIEQLKEESINHKNKNYFHDPCNLIPDDKLRILNYLAFMFEGVENNYFIEKYTLGGLMDYRYVTDICIPRLKIDFEFPNSFWHNWDIPKVVRDFRLRADGWTIIDINDSAPSVSSIEIEVEKIIK